MSKKVLGLIVALVVVLAVAIPFGMKKFGNDVAVSNDKSNSEQAGSSQNSSGGSNSSSDNLGSNASKDNQAEDGQAGDNGDGSSGDGSGENNGTGGSNGTGGGTGNGGSGGNNGGSGNGGSGNNGGGSNGGSNSPNKKIPSGSNYDTPDSDLVIQHVNGYTGIYVEDGSDQEIENVAAIKVYNSSSKAVEFAQIELYNGNKKLEFEVSSVPSKSSVIVMDKNKAKFSSSKGVTYGKSTVAYVDSLEKTSNVGYKITDNNGITLTNKSGKDIPCVRVFYKYRYEKEYYIGGITYTVKVEDLKAGESATIYPSHFYTGGTEVMMVKTYSTKN